MRLHSLIRIPEVGLWYQWGETLFLFIRLIRNCSRHLRCLLALLVLCGPSVSVYADSKPSFWNRFRKPSSTKTKETKAVSDDYERSFSQNEHRPGKAPAEISLNYVQSTWKKVLEQVAEQNELTLVMDVVPKGFFSRRDKRLHSFDQTLQILNRELEPKGFRLLQKDKFLVVLDLRQTKAKYIPPTIQNGKSKINTERKNHGVQQVNYQKQTKASESRITQPDVPATFEESAQKLPKSQSKLRKTLFSVRPSTLSSTEILRQFYHALETRAELQGEGPGGFPGIVVFMNGTQKVLKDESTDLENPVDSHIDFRIGLDKENNALVFECASSKANSLRSTVMRLDQAAKGYAESIQLVSGTMKIGRVAQTLHEQLKASTVKTGSHLSLSQNSAPKTPPHLRNRSFNQLRQRIDQISFDEKQPENTSQDPVPPGPAEKPDQAQKQQALPELLQDLKGNVNIESVPDLGVLILRGKDEDVEALMKIIKELEELSAGTRPDIHLLNLRHVNSTALADLLNGVYEELVNLRAIQGQTQKIKFIPLGKPNALLILAPDTDMPSILKLAEELDQPVNPLTEFGVFHLKSASATQVSTTLREFYDERGGLGTRIIVSPNIRTNSIIVQAQPRDMQEVAALIQKIDQDQSKAISRVKIFPLKNAIAEDLAETLNSTLQSVLNPAAARTAGSGANFGGAGGETAQQLQEARSVVLEFLTHDGSQSQVLRSGLLADIRVIADPRANTLVVTAPKDSLELVEALINQFDQRVSTVAELKVFTLKNADADLMVTLLQSTFSVENQQTDLGIQIAGIDDTNSNLVPLKFTVDRRTNSVVAQGGADALQIVEAILLKLDGADSRKRETTVIQLKNTPVADVAVAINEFLDTQRSLIAQDPDLISSFELLEREIIVVPEPINNNLIISATPRYFAEISNLVKELDKEAPQVIIQALIVEVELDNDDEFGVELGIQDSLLFNRSIIDNILTVQQTVTGQNNVTQTNQTIVSQEATPGFLFNSINPLGTNNSNNVGNTAGQALSNFSLQRGNDDLGFGGLVLSASSESVSVLIRALAAKRNVHILSRPQIRTVDNVTAQIQVGQIVPVVNGVTVSSVGSANPVIEQDEAGIILAVTPRISPDGNIVMETIAEKSDFDGQSVPIFTDATTGNVVESPIKNITQVQTTVSVPNGQTVVLGGMITESDTTIERKVPWLGDIPFLGIPFRYDSSSTRRKELLVFLTPRIIQNDADSEFIKQVEAERIHLMEEKAEEMHGPIFAVPPGEPEFIPDGDGLLEPIPPAEMPQSNLNSSEMIENESSGEIQQIGYETEALTKRSKKKPVKQRRFPYWGRD
ncbi:secretin N-terminal domain-containing protein [Gimesia aquarii]|uniref:Type II secretion system protein D n=1 Tax=Gimesia aquarii TaxID=2527964 RepID=A0A517WST6_9PLAN|nr:secretin N-terminal domain-containing protein [Gimesia aquarii]QDU08310.1 Putative type II secretion system protein D precursor [Gimesia aquarii]